MNKIINKKNVTVFIIVIAIITVIGIIVCKRKTEKVPEYEIEVYNERYTINSKSCADLSQKEVQEIASEIFYANHNIIRTFHDYSELTQKDYQMTGWFAKCKGENEDKCSKKEFEQIIKDVYNVSYTQHESLENTMEYSNGQYKLTNYEMKEYQYPIIERIESADDNNTYSVIFALTNTHSNYIRKIKYKATIKRENKNLYIKSITEHII